MTDKEKIEAIKDEIECRIDTDCYNDNPREELESLLELIDSLQEEPVSEQNLSNVERTGKNWKEAVSEAAEDYSKSTLVGSPYIKKNAFKAGANWQKEQLLAKAVDFTQEHNIACILASECLRNHGWFSRERVFNNLFRHLACVDKLFEGKFSGKTKVIVIKED